LQRRGERGREIGSETYLQTDSPKAQKSVEVEVTPFIVNFETRSRSQRGNSPVCQSLEAEKEVLRKEQRSL